MSTVLAIAGVSAILQDMLANRFATDPVAAAVGTFNVTTLPPDRVDLTTPADPTQVNIFLHQATQNPGWANYDQPVRDSRGARLSAPPLALDLHYLISVYGAQALFAEILLGQIAQEFHENAVPTPAMIERALDPASPPPGFPAALAQSGLADQFERLRITPEAMSNEEISKLWSALQARYRPTLAFRVTTVLIDSDLTTGRALPARAAQAGAGAAPRPLIARIRPRLGILTPVVAGTELIVTGSGLVAEDRVLRIGDLDLTAAITSAEPDRLELTLPTPLPAGLRAGAQPVTVVHRRPFGSPPEVREVAISPPAILVITPVVSAAFAAGADTVVDGVTYRDGTITLTLTPPVTRAQRVTLFLNATDGSGRSYAFRAPDGNGLAPTATETAMVDVTIAPVPVGSYLVRAQVDAGESALTTAADGTYDGPDVTI